MYWTGQGPWRKIASMSQDPDEQISKLLRTIETGDSIAAEDLLPLVYDRLKALAAARLRRIPPGQTLQPTALVHEAYMRVLGRDDPGWNSHHHFFAAVSRAMRNILVDQARKKASVKHGGSLQRLHISPGTLADAIQAPAEDMLALSEVLIELEKASPRQHQLVMLRFFGGLGILEAAEVVGVNERTARRDWVAARLFLARRLGAEPGLGGRGGENE